jgi:hypothetical protein
MTSDITTIEAEKELADQILATVTLLPEISNFETSIGTDSSGDAALRVTLWVTPEAVQQRGDIKKLTQFVYDVHTALQLGGVKSFPYISLDEAA